MGNGVSSQLKACESGKTDVLDIHGKGLSKLPESIFQVTAVHELNCSCNKIKSIPGAIGILKHSQKKLYFQIFRSSLFYLLSFVFCLSICVFKIGSLIKLERLNCFSNRISELPVTMQQLGVFFIFILLFS